jgi:hypothetical protein
MNSRQRLVASAVIAVAALGALAAPTPAEAWWRGGWGCCGVGIGLGFYPPVYVPPPVYYAPPPAYYAPPPPTTYYSQAQPPYSPAPAEPSGTQSCYAGNYVCPMDHPTASGSPCWCSANGGRVYGRSN